MSYIKTTYKMIGALSSSVAVLGNTFTPADISGLQFWQDASNPNGDGTLPTDLSPISNWVDLGPLGNNATQASGSAQPIFTKNQLNSLPILAFNGSSDFLVMNNGFANTTTDMTYFVVASFPNVVQGSNIIGDSVQANNNRISVAFPYTAGPVFYIFDFGNISGGGRLTGAWSQSYNTYYVFSFVVSSAAGGSMTIYLNGTQIYTKSGSSSFLPTGLAAWICKFDGVGFEQTNIAEHFFYNAALNSTQLGQLNTYLNNKWF